MAQVHDCSTYWVEGPIPLVSVLCSRPSLAFLPHSWVRTHSSPLSLCTNLAQMKAQERASVVAQWVKLYLGHSHPIWNAGFCLSYSASGPALLKFLGGSR